MRCICVSALIEHTLQFRKLRSAEIEHNADNCILLSQLSAVVCAPPFCSPQSPCILHGCGHLRILVETLRILMCRQGCAVSCEHTSYGPAWCRALSEWALSIHNRREGGSNSKYQKQRLHNSELHRESIMKSTYKT